MEKLFCVFPAICEADTTLPEDINDRAPLYEKHLSQPIIMTFDEFQEFSESHHLTFEILRQCKDPDTRLRIMKYELPRVCYSSILWNQAFGINESEKLRSYNGIVALEVIKDQALEYMIFRLSSFEFVVYASDSADGKGVVVLSQTDCHLASMHSKYVAALTIIFQNAGFSIRSSDARCTTTTTICYSKGAYINNAHSSFTLNPEYSNTID